MKTYKYHEEKPHFKKRIFWHFINATLFRILIGPINNKLRILLLKCFGLKHTKDSGIYSTAKIFAPWNLEIGRSCIGPNTIIYNKDKIIIGNDCVISQGAHLCTGSHDISSPRHSLITAPIIIKDHAWIAADAFIGPGVTIGEGAVVGARAAVFKDVEPWTVVGGNPAKFIKKRELKDEE